MNLPIKKRYIILFITIVYCIAKIYVIYTPDTKDDNIPDHVRDAAIRAFAVNDDAVLAYQQDQKGYA